AFLHMVADTASSVAIVAGAIAIHYTKFLVIDPILSIIIAFAILIWGYNLIRESVNILLERTPEHINIEDLSADIKRSIPEIKHIHDIHIWTITSGMYAMTAHIIVDDRLVSETDAISDKLRNLLNKKYDINHTTLQFETDSQSCISC
ncbi:MAG: cation diffusion facilitator family transporter, partial [Candidatus Aenigmatarchaeota archaeon]